MHKTTLLASAILAVASFQVQAQSNSEMMDDRWEISGSYFKPDISLAGQANLTGTDGTEIVSMSERGRVGSGVDGAKIDVSFRLSQRQRLMGGWYEVGRDRSWGLNEQGTYAPEGGDPVDYSVQGSAHADAKFQLYRLSYGYDLIQSPDFTLTGLVGVYGARLKLKGETEGVAEVDGEAFDLASSSTWDERRHAPGLGVAAFYSPADNWDIRAQAQGFQTSWGDFDTDGHFLHASAEVGYRFTPTWTVFAGYDWFKLKLEDNVSTSANFDGSTYTVSGPASAQLKVHGPTVGLRASF